MDPNMQNQQQIQPIPEPYSNDGDKVDLDDIKGKIFIGGLSWQTTELNLRYYFEKFGELSDVALMIDKRSGKPRGFGFIKMKDPAAADIVMSNEHTIDGRLVDVKRALPRDKAPGPTRSEACKVFVGGLASEITEKEFGDYFSKFGIVKDAVVMVDRNTGSSRGFGFVTFEKEETVEIVMKQEHEIMGKYVETKRAEPRDARSGAGGYDGGMGGMYGGGGPMGGGGMYGAPGGGGGYMNNSGGRGGGGRGMGGGYGGRYGGRGGGGGMMQPDNNYQGAGGYVGGYQPNGGGYGAGPMRAGGGGGGSGGRYPAGYGGAGYARHGYPVTGGGVSGGPPSGAVNGGYGGAAGGGYPNPSGAGVMNPQAAANMGYYGGAAPNMVAPGGYAGYGAAAGATGGAAAGGYGGAAAYGGAAGRGGPNGMDGGAAPEYNGGVGSADYRGQQQGAHTGYDTSAIAGYANAAIQQQMRSQQQQPYQYGGAASNMPANYGATGYGYPPAAASPVSAAVQGRMGPGGMEGNTAGYGGAEQQQQPGGTYGGAYRGQGAAQGRVDRSYRPY